MDKISKKNKTMKIILKIKKLLQDYNLDAYIVPKNDEFFSEYAFPNRLKTVSNFTGSAGFCIITKSENLSQRHQERIEIAALHNHHRCKIMMKRC